MVAPKKKKISKAAKAPKKKSKKMLAAKKKTVKKLITPKKKTAKVKKVKKNEKKIISKSTNKTTKKSAKTKAVKLAATNPPYYFFGGGKADGDLTMRDLLGGKGAGLAEMSRIGINVPPGFTITTEVCDLYYKNNMEIPKDIDKDLEKQIAKIEKLVGLKFGDPDKPLLVSVRSGAKFSMPGMMDTVLNLGLNEETLKGFTDITGNERFVFDNYRRFIQMFGNVVLDIDKEKFEGIIEAKKKGRKIRQDSSLQVADLNDIIKKFKQFIKHKTG